MKSQKFPHLSKKLWHCSSVYGYCKHETAMGKQPLKHANRLCSASIRSVTGTRTPSTAEISAPEKSPQEDFPLGVYLAPAAVASLGLNLRTLGATAMSSALSKKHCEWHKRKQGHTQELKKQDTGLVKGLRSPTYSEVNWAFRRKNLPF